MRLLQQANAVWWGHFKRPLQTLLNEASADCGKELAPIFGLMFGQEFINVGNKLRIVRNVVLPRCGRPGSTKYCR